jgi:peroxiredoxin
MTGDQTFQLQGRPAKYTVLYFYPKDNTPGCTTEAMAFRDHHDEFTALAPPSTGSAAIRCAPTRASRPSSACRSN